MSAKPSGIEPSKIELREAVPSDEPRVQKLLAMLSAAAGTGETPEVGSTFASLLTQERGRVVVAEEDGKILGMVSVSYNLALRCGEYCQLEELIVDPEARGKNVGGLLVQKSIDDARARGCAEYGLYLVEKTEHNRPFYEKYGIQAVGTEMRLPL